MASIKGVEVRSLRRHGNIISSLHFLKVRHNGTDGEVKLKCRFVPHGNREKDKELLRCDSATAQFPILRMVFSIAAKLKLVLDTIDIKDDYRQGEPLLRDIYTRPPRDWASTPRMVWKILKPAYELVESGRLWQLLVEA